MTLSPNKTKRREQLQFICVHWSGGSYESSLDWCLREESEVSYHMLIGPTGIATQIVPWEYAAWAVGYAKSIDFRVAFKNANHASISIALAGGPPTEPTIQQVQALELWILDRMRAAGWGKDDVWRIWGHNQCAVYGPTYKKAGQFGRKPDPEGSNWLPLEPLRKRIYAALDAGSFAGDRGGTVDSPGSHS